MSKPTIESVSEAIGQWRKLGVKRLPTSLWQDLFSLEPTHSLFEISEATGISKQYLRKKFRKRRPGFVEVQLARTQASYIVELPPPVFPNVVTAAMFPAGGGG